MSAFWFNVLSSLVAVAVELIELGSLNKLLNIIILFAWLPIDDMPQIQHRNSLC